MTTTVALLGVLGATSALPTEKLNELVNSFARRNGPIPAQEDWRTTWPTAANRASFNEGTASYTLKGAFNNSARCVIDFITSPNSITVANDAIQNLTVLSTSSYPNGSRRNLVRVSEPISVFGLFDIPNTFDAVLYRGPSQISDLDPQEGFFYSIAAEGTPLETMVAHRFRLTNLLNGNSELEQTVYVGAKFLVRGLITSMAERAHRAGLEQTMELFRSKAVVCINDRAVIRTVPASSSTESQAQQ